MKKVCFLLAGLMAFGFTIHAQTMRYFEFSTDCGHGRWQDSSFIAATDDPAVITALLEQLALPRGERNRFISGAIDHGDGGHNHNAGHAFRWHFVPNEWSLAEAAMEVCDGCPYSDLDSDTAYWIGLIGAYCPWSGFPAREVNAPTGIETPAFLPELTIYPNPASGQLHIRLEHPQTLYAKLVGPTGMICNAFTLSGTQHTLNLAGLAAGLYFLEFTDGKHTTGRKLLIE